jgi:signal transduction histidine kinase
MKPYAWPVRWKLTFWTAGLVAFAVGAVGVVSSVHLHREGLEDLDREIKRAASDFSRTIDPLSEQVGDDERDQISRLKTALPYASATLFVEVRTRSGDVVYRSPNIGEDSMPTSLPRGVFVSTRVNQRPIRAASFKHHHLFLNVGLPTHAVDEVRSDLLRCYFVAAPAVFALVAMGAWFTAKRALQPVEDIAAAAENITVRHLHQRLPVPATADEVSRLTIVLNKMIDRLEASFMQATRFTADASHELKTPLTVIRGELEAALRSGDLPAGQEKRLVELLDETERLTRIVERLLLLSRADASRFELELQPLNLTELTSDLVEDVEILAEPHKISVDSQLDPNCWINGNPEFLRQLCLNLLDNAVKYNRVGGRILITTRSDQEACSLLIGNTGAGLRETDIPHVFDRFYRGDAPRGSRPAGQGLGLSLCREIARAHHAEIKLSHSAEDWTEFTVTFPVAPTDPAPRYGTPIIARG